MNSVADVSTAVTAFKMAPIDDLCEAIRYPREFDEDFIDSILQTDGINLSERDQYGWTPLHVAAFCDNARATRLLLTHPTVLINARSAVGETALHVAMARGAERVCTALIQGGADIHARDGMGHNPAEKAEWLVAMTLLGIMERHREEDFDVYDEIDFILALDFLESVWDVVAASDRGASPIWGLLKFSTERRHKN